MKTAVIQLKSGNDKEKNIAKALCLVKCAVARKAEFILLPEAFPFRGKVSVRRGYADVSERVPGPSTAALMDVARKAKVAILAGSVCEAIPGEKKVYNTSVLIGPRGEVAAKYRKVHLFDAKVGGVRMQESKHFKSGRTNAMAKVGTWSVGLSICYDLRFPGFYGKYKQGKADILCVPSAFTKVTGQAHWEVLLRARAVENLCYVLAPNQTGKDGKGVASYGNSMIVDPWGKVLARASGGREEIIFADLDKRLIKERRGMLGF